MWSDERARAEDVGEELDVLWGGIDGHDPDGDVRLPQRLCLADERVTVAHRIVEVADEDQRPMFHVRATEGLQTGRETVRDPGTRR